MSGGRGSTHSHMPNGKRNSIFFFHFLPLPLFATEPVEVHQMFGLIVAGRAVQINPQQLSETKYLYAIEDGANVNHIVIFLVGTPLPPNLAAGVYFSWPPYQEWKFLGYISNEKPSAVFKLSGTNPKPSSEEMEMSSPESSIIQIGISIEPIQSIQQQISQKEFQQSSTSSYSSALVPITTPSPNDMIRFCQKMLENLFNYALSFSKKTTGFAPSSQMETIPTEVFKKWYENFEGKLQKDPYFWKR